MLKIPQVNLKALSFEAFVLFHFGVITYYSEQIRVWGLLEWKLSLGRFLFWTFWSVIRIASLSWFSFRWCFKLLIFLRFLGNVVVDLASTCNSHWHVVCILLTYGSEGDQTFFSIFKTECSCLISIECNRFGCMFSLNFNCSNYAAYSRCPPFIKEGFRTYFERKRSSQITN